MNYILRFSAIFTLLFVLPGIITQGKTAPPIFDKARFYTAMSKANVDEIDYVLAQLKESLIPEKTAYEGVLMMKKAGLLTKAKEKLSLFKSGREKLEAAINNDDGNVEYHFLRLIIQEKAPKIVKYRSNLKRDTEMVTTLFKKLPPVVQQAVRDYSKKSAFLKPADL
ncbi:MAG: hypothetical protein ABI760_19395 [Ferruginibacter sp.]